MKALFHHAAELQKLFERKGWRFCFIGGVALQRWGEPRLTIDVDVTLFTGFGEEAAYVEVLLSHYRPRREDAREFALASRVLLLQTEDNVGIDVALAGLPFEEEMVRRATYYEFLPGLRLLTCSAEDLVITKAFADRGRDWIDIEGVVIRQIGNLDWGYVRGHLSPLCELKEAPHILDRLDSLRRRGG